MDISQNYVLYFFLVGLVFLAFISILSIFGFSFLYFIKKKQKTEIMKNTSILEEFFIGFGIGLSLYVSISYMLDLFSLFNFFFSYLLFLIIDCVFVFYYYSQNKEKLKATLNRERITNYFKTVFSNNDNVFSLGVLITTLLIVLTIQWFIVVEATSLIYTDPFKWYQTVFYLIDHGHIDYYHLDYNYPSGYTFFNAGVLLIFPDYLFGYYYFKFVPLYFISLYIIIAFIVIRKLFTKRYLIVLSFLLILSSRYFLSRTLLYLSSSLASGLLIISLLIIINKYPDYIMGFFIAGLYLIHNLTTFYFIFVVLLFFLYKLLIQIRNRELFFKQFFSIMLLVLIVFILIIPYLTSIYYIYNDSIFDFINHFFERFEEADYAHVTINPEILYENQFKLIFPLDYFIPFVEINFLELFDELFERSIFLFFIFPIIGVFIHLKRDENGKNQELLIFFKIFIIVILIFFFLPYFFPSFNLFIKFRKRILQSFNLPIVIMTLYTIEWIINLARRFTIFLVKRFKFYSKLLNKNKFYSRIFKIESVVALLLFTSISSTFIMHRYPDYHYYYDDELVEVVLYLRTHAESGSRILRRDYETTPIFRMLYDMKVKEWDLNKSSTYDALLLEVDERDIDYLIFPKDYFHNETIDDLINEEDDYKELIDNDEYFLFKIKN